jgi:hypothetical protein
MLIPSIDLMGGKIVQLVQGEKKALEFDNFEYWIERFSKYPLVQVIDLDAARRTGEQSGNRESDCSEAELSGWRRAFAALEAARESPEFGCAPNHSRVCVVGEVARSTRSSPRS